MKPASAKAKGRRLQNQVRDDLIDRFEGQLRDGDVKCTVMGEGGEDLILSPHAKDLIPFSFEMKNVERLNIWDALKQAEKNARTDASAALIFTRNRTPVYAVVRWEVLLELIYRTSRCT